MQINVVYPKGSTGKIVDDINNELKKQGHESIVCYGRGKTIKRKNVYKTSWEILAKINALRTRIFGFEYGGAFLSTLKLISIIKKEKPDVVHLHCLNGYFVNIYKLLNFLKTNGIKTVLTLHAEFMYTGNCTYSDDCDKWKEGCYKCKDHASRTNSKICDISKKSWNKMQRCFKNFENISIVAVSSWVAERAKQSGIMKGHKIYVVENGIDIETFKFQENIKSEEKYNNEKLLLHVTSGTNNMFKGFKYLLELANILESENIKILLIGSKKNIDLPKNIINIGKVYDKKELAKYYSMADLTILTSKRETFSMICAESLACGTPVIGFKAGAPERISIKKFSEFVDYGDLDNLNNKILEWLVKDINKKEISKLSRSKYSAKKMANEYIEIYKNGKELKC